MRDISSPPSNDTTLLKLGIGMVGVGLVLTGYALTVEVFAIIPTFTFDTRHLRWGTFVVGLVTLSVGFALAAQEFEARRAGRSKDS